MPSQDFMWLSWETVVLTFLEQVLINLRAISPAPILYFRDSFIFVNFVLAYVVHLEYCPHTALPPFSHSFPLCSFLCFLR